MAVAESMVSLAVVLGESVPTSAAGESEEGGSRRVASACRWPARDASDTGADAETGRLERPKLVDAEGGGVPDVAAASGIS